MRWYPKKHEPDPVHYSTRKLEKFALWPKRCDDGVLVWLSHYWIIQEYCAYREDFVCGYDGMEWEFTWIKNGEAIAIMGWKWKNLRTIGYPVVAKLL